MRSDFEKWFKTSRSYLILKEANYYDLDLFEFNEIYKRYIHSGVQIAFETWQHRQTEVDELQKRVDAALIKLDKRWNESWSKWKEGADMQDQGAANAFEEAYWLLEQALKGES